MTANVMVDVIGWMAAASILAAYALLTAGRIRADSRAYQWLNVLGAAGFILNSGWHGAVPSAVLNVIWAGIGMAALVRIARRRPTPE